MWKGLSAALAAAMLAAAPDGADEGTFYRAEGIEVRRDMLERADDGMGVLLVARLDPAAMETDIAADDEDGPAEDEAPWTVTANAGYFDDEGSPVHLLRDRQQEFAPFRPGASAVFWCAGDHCAIEHASRFDPRAPRDLAVQSTPRLLNAGKPTAKVRGADEVDARTGIATTAKGEVLVFATPPQSWWGASFAQIRDHLAKTYGARDVLMLDGGSSAQMTVRIGDTIHRSGRFARSVPFRLVFSGR